MKLYHGSNIEIERIDLSGCKPFKDFGKGFYLTEIELQAKQMASRTALIFGGEPRLATFEFDMQRATEDDTLKIKFFNEPNKEWALFIMNNRSRTNGCNGHDYDIVIGPVADDNIATLFRNFEDEIIDLDMLVNGLKYNKTSSQYLFHTTKSLKYLVKL